ncbi:hypothetical protein tpqmel_0175 [Candidatus Gastranaerophilus sp. (ex Termes propinquus)]|nr:hypothetical protein tpqmel_0175 [Candidatus Gastranaerophilus sp. (ex Termes propinquus)]
MGNGKFDNAARFGHSVPRGRSYNLNSHNGLGLTVAEGIDTVEVGESFTVKVVNPKYKTITTTTHTVVDFVKDALGTVALKTLASVDGSHIRLESTVYKNDAGIFEKTGSIGVIL